MFALLVAHLALAQPSDRHADSARAIVREASRAVDGDSAERVAARWRSRTAKDPNDRLALLGLANIAHDRFEYAVAESLYARLITNPPGAHDAVEAYARLGLAQIDQVRGAFLKSMAGYDTAALHAHAAGASAAERVALIGLALVTARRGDLATVKDLLARAWRDLRDDDLETRAALLCRASSIPGLEPPGVPLARALEGAELARRVGDERQRAQCLLVAGLAQIGAAKQRQGLATLAEAASIQRRIRDRVTLAITLQQSGYARLAIGEFSKARAELVEAITEGLASGNASAAAWARLDIASQSMRMHDRATAVTLLDSASAAFRAQGDLFGLQVASGFEAFAFLADGRLEEAWARYSSITPRLEQIGQLDPAADAHRALFLISLQRHDTVSARRELDAIQRIARRLRWPNESTGRSPEFGLWALTQGRLDEAARVFSYQAFGVGGGDHRYLSGVRLAQVQLRRGEPVRAESTFARALNALDQWRDSLESRQLRLFAFQREPWNFGQTESAVAEVIAGLARSGRTDVAFEFAERQRARQLVDELVQAELSRVDTTPVQQQSMRHGSSAVRRAVTAREVAAAIPDDSTALLEFVTGRGGGPTTVFLLTRARTASFLAPPIDSLLAPIARLGAMVEGGGDAAALSRSLGAVLLDSAVAAAPAAVRRLVIVPDDALHRIPFDVLTLADGRAVIERYATSVAPSAAVALELWRRSGTRDPVRVLAFGDPVYPGPNGGSGAASGAAADVFRDAFAKNGGLVRLPASGTEAEDAARFAPRSVVRLRDGASESFLKHARLGDFRVLHFATHALVDEASVDRTALALASGDGEDGFVSPSEIAELHLDADLVVLSACRSASGVVVRGEGVQGLTAPLLRAGARSVVATRWRIADRAAARFVNDFYRALAGGAEVSDALRAAKLEARARGAAPAEWAAFTVVGDPLVRVPLAPPSHHARTAVLLALACVALALLVVAVLGRRRSA